jgi:MFS family permease
MLKRSSFCRKEEPAHLNFLKTEMNSTTPMESDPAGRWRALVTLAASSVLSMGAWFSASAVLPQLRALWHLSAGVGAWMTISVQLGFVAGCLLSASLNLADLVRPRRLMLIGACLAAVINAALLFCSGPASALPVRFLTGASLAFVYPPSLKAMATWFRRQRGTALGTLVGGLTLGSAMPHLLNGLGGLDWRVVIVGTSLLTLTGGLVAELGTRDGPFPFPRAVFDPRQIFASFANRGVRLATLGYFGHMWELYAMWTWFAAFYADVLRAHGVAAFQKDAAFSAFAVIGSGALGCWAAGRLADSWGRTRTTALAMILSGACALVIGWSALPVAAVLVLAVVWGFSVVADSAQFSTMVTEVGDQAYVGTALTMQLAVGFTLTVVTIWLVPVMRERVGWHIALAMLALGPVLGVAAMLRLKNLPEAAKIAGGLG